jgi:hypothetical protein
MILRVSFSLVGGGGGIFAESIREEIAEEGRGGGIRENEWFYGC